MTSTVTTAASNLPAKRSGRPPTYRPEFCEQIVAYMGRGFSKTAFAGHIGVARETIFMWADRHPDFHNAVKQAEAARVRALEGQMLRTDKNAKVIARIFALKNAAPDEWKDRQEFVSTRHVVLHPAAVLDEISRADPETAKLLASRFGVELGSSRAIDVTPIEPSPDTASGDDEG